MTRCGFVREKMVKFYKDFNRWQGDRYMGKIKDFHENTRKPTGFLGKLMIKRMNFRHSKVSAWGLAHLKLFSPAEILEIGCGGGKNAAELRRMFPSAKVTAIDYSEVSVAAATKYNKGDIITKRMQVMKADVSALPFADASFDLATAFETIYFWPGPLESFKEVYRILQPGGIFMIVNESDGENNAEEQWSKKVEGIRVYTKMQLIRILKEAGFSEFSVDQNTSKHWLCVIAKK